ncbi:MAG: hypothetical protein K6T30_04665 [Alicyclobacillus sp.]|nr:hypothetical protein [Alicyclobacillus sp.]
MGGISAATIGRWVLEAIDIAAVLAIVCCVPIQRKAMNPIAFGRSMFISGAAIVTGFIISLIPTVSGAIVGSLLMVLGFGLMILMAVKSYQRLRAQADRRYEGAPAGRTMGPQEPSESGGRGPTPGPGSE